MAGRGRGRGRGAPLTGAQQFLQQSEKEHGIDARTRSRPLLFPTIHLHSSGDHKLLQLMKQQQAERDKMVREGIVDPAREKVLKEEEEALKKLSSSGTAGTKRSLQAVYLIQKGREMHHRVRSSAFYVRPTKYVPDVIRSSDSTRPPPRIDASAVLSNCLGGRVETETGRFVPEELVSGQVLLGGQGGDNLGEGGKLGLEELKARERMRRLGSRDKDYKEGEGDGEEQVDGEWEEYDEEEDEDDDVEDYAVNHYESEPDGDESDGQDAEPTY